MSKFDTCIFYIGTCSILAGWTGSYVYVVSFIKFQTKDLFFSGGVFFCNIFQILMHKHSVVSFKTVFWSKDKHFVKKNSHLFTHGALTRVCVFQIKWNLEVFVIGDKTSQSKGENKQQTQPTYGIDARFWIWTILVGGECLHHCAILAPPTSAKVKTESTRKLSNFNFEWTKTLYQNNLKNIVFFLHFSMAKDVISHLW